MELVDIIFPQHIAPLTYQVPQALRTKIKPGMMVEADIRKSLKKGIVLGPGVKGDYKGKFKQVHSIVEDGIILTPPMLELLRWMAGYYMAKEGTILKAMFPSEFFEKVKRRIKAESASGDNFSIRSTSVPYGLDREGLEAVEASILSKKFNAFLLHAPNTRYEVDFLGSAIEGHKGVIILAPDIGAMKLAEAKLTDTLGDKLVVYNSRMSKGQRSEALERMASGDVDVILGSISAVFAPLPEVSLFVVLHEEATQYKSEPSPYHNARDVAVKRASLHGATVLLSSICPSVESMYNVSTGKYSLIDAQSDAPRPRVVVLGTKGLKTALSPAITVGAKKAQDDGQGALVHVNKKGHSILWCADCGYVQECPKCEITMTYSKATKTNKCAYCGENTKPPETCPDCGGHNLELVGAGLERVEEELAELNPVGITKGRKAGLKVVMEEAGSVAVGTTALTRSDALSQSFTLAAVVNAEAFLFKPDFRAAERALEDLLYLSEKVTPKGQVLVQTSQPNLPLFDIFRSFDFKLFYDEEFKHRGETKYPPFGKLAAMRMTHVPNNFNVNLRYAEVLGPVGYVGKRGKKGYKLLIKAASSVELQRAVTEVIKALGKSKATVDIDPLEV